MKKRNQLKLMILGATGALASSANAAIDVSGVTTGFGDLTTAITTVGGLILGAAVVAIAFKWIKAMLFS